MNAPNSCMTRKDKYYVFFNVLKCEDTSCISKYECEYDENVKLLIYHLTSQSLWLIL